MKIKSCMKRIGVLAVAIVYIFAVFPLCVKAEGESQAVGGWPKAPDVSAASAVVMEINSGAILYEKDSHTQRYPASITKILTTLIAIEKCDLKEEVTFSADAVYKNEGDTSHISRDVGEKMTLEQCLYAVMLFSANECAYAVAEHVAEKDGRDYSHFIDMMNERAKSIGCTDTHFHNCNGLPDEEHLTSAYDMALIGREAYKNKIFRKITGTGKYTIPPTNKHKDETPLVNHHNMLYPFTTREYLYKYCTGGKTGYTKVARNTLVTFAEKDGLELVCVVMKDDKPDHYLDTTKLMEYGFNNFSAVKIQESGSKNTSIGASAGILNKNPSYASLEKNSYVVLPKGVDFSETTYKAYTEKQSNKQLASIKFVYNKHIVGMTWLTTNGVKVSDIMFDQSAVQNVDDQSSSKQITIHVHHILLGFLIMALIVGIVFLIRRITVGRYARRHSRQMKKMERDCFREKRPKRKYRKKDRIFH